MNEYFRVSFRGGDDRPLFVHPSRTVEQIRALYPEALSVVGINKQEFMVLCDRMSRVSS